MMLLSENYFHEEQFSRTKMTFKPILKYMLYVISCFAKKSNVHSGLNYRGLMTFQWRTMSKVTFEETIIIFE